MAGSNQTITGIVTQPKKDMVRATFPNRYAIKTMNKKKKKKIREIRTISVSNW